MRSILGLLCFVPREGSDELGVLYLGLGLYALNLLVGVAAQMGRRFGIGHHILYAAVFLSAGAACVWAFHPALFVTLVALAAMPKTRPGGPWHPLMAVIGLCGYVVVLLDS